MTEPESAGDRRSVVFNLDGARHPCCAADGVTGGELLAHAIAGHRSVTRCPFAREIVSVDGGAGCRVAEAQLRNRERGEQQRYVTAPIASIARTE
jgi:hypothetical protein